MTRLSLIFSELLRVPARTAFTIASLAIGFLLFGLLHGLDAEFDAAVKRMRVDRLLCDPRFGEPALPLGYVARIERISGVKELTWTVFLTGTYQRPEQNVILLASDAQRFFRVRDEYQTSSAALEALTRTRTGIIVLDRLAQMYGWKVGDRVPIESKTLKLDGSGTWTFDVVGLMSNPSNPTGVPLAVANYDYLNEARMANKDTVGRYVIRVDSPLHSTAVANAIDQMFISSAAPTRTQGENEVAQTQLATVGDIRRITAAVIAGVLLSILFLSANVILHAVHERAGELAVLEALGFPPGALALNIAGESLLIYAIAAILGLGSAALIYPILSRRLPEVTLWLVSSGLSLQVILEGLFVAAVLGLISAAAPAWRALQVSPADALRGRA
jgi:putative ABC transport system permease protein